MGHRRFPIHSSKRLVFRLLALRLDVGLLCAATLILPTSGPASAVCVHGQWLKQHGHHDVFSFLGFEKNLAPPDRRFNPILLWFTAPQVFGMTASPTAECVEVLRCKAYVCEDSLIENYQANAEVELLRYPVRRYNGKVVSTNRPAKGMQRMQHSTQLTDDDQFHRPDL